MARAFLGGFSIQEASVAPVTALHNCVGATRQPEHVLLRYVSRSQDPPSCTRSTRVTSLAVLTLSAAHIRELLVTAREPETM